MTFEFDPFPSCFFSRHVFPAILNGFNQFTTRFNPFGRPLTQSQPVFQQFPQQTNSFPEQTRNFGQQRPPPPPQTPPPTRPPQPTASPFGNSFQTVRFPSQNQQFGGAFSSQQQPQQPPQQPQFASFPAQQPRQPPPAQRPPFTAFNQFSPSTPVVPTQTAPPPR